MQNGYEQIFDFKEEQALVQHLVYMASIGYGYTKMSTCIQRIAKEYAISLNKNNCKNENSEHLINIWFYGFLKRLESFYFPCKKCIF